MSEKIIKKALKVMEESFKEGTDKLNSATLTMDYCRLQLANEKDEVFSIIFLDNHLRMLGFDKMFRGTVNQSSVHLRPIVRKALELNAAKIIFAHNHPSGIVKPSESDLQITRKFKKVLDALDCKLVDHVIVSPIAAYSMRERGEIFNGYISSNTCAQRNESQNNNMRSE